MAKAKATGSSWDGKHRMIENHAHPQRMGDDYSFARRPSAYVKAMRREGIDAVVLLGPGEVCQKAARKFGDFVAPVPMYHLRDLARRDLRDEIEYWLDHGCKGIKFISPLHPYGDERYWPLYQTVADHDAVAIFHTGYLGIFSREPQIPPISIDHMRAAHVDTIARRFPTLKLLMAHYGNPLWEEAWKVCLSTPNIYADMSGGTAFMRDLTMWQQTFAPNGQLMEGALAKLCFGTDTQYLHDGPHGFTPYIDFYQKLLDRINAPEKLRRLVWSGNTRKLFGIKG